MMKIKKKIMYLLSLLILILPIWNPVLALVDYNVGSGEASTGNFGGGSSGPEEGEGPMESIEYTVGNSTITRAYNCDYIRLLSVKSNYYLRVYDMEDNDIIEQGFIIKDENLPLAGTAIGINLLEEKVITRAVNKVTVDVYETTRKPKAVYKCQYETLPPVAIPPIIGSVYVPAPAPDIEVNECETTEKTTYSSTKCPEPEKYCKLASSKPVFSGYSPDEFYESEKQYTYVYEYDKGTPVSAPSGSIDARDQEKINQCLNSAINWTVTISNWYMNSSYSLEITDSNDTNGTNAVKISNTSATKTAKVYDKDKNPMNCPRISDCYFKVPEDSASISEKTYDQRTIEMFYKKAKTCINVKTSEVSYKDSEKDSCGPDEFEISNTTLNTSEGDFEHWHYFIPLNAKSSEGIEFKMLNTAKDNLSKESCLYVMQNNYISADGSGKNDFGYIKLIKPIQTGAEFIGDYKCTNCKGSNEQWNDSVSADYAEVVKNGCSLTSTVSIPIKQGFYNETTEKDSSGKESTRFNGFNFYYKPIDVNNSTEVDIVFPNGANADKNGDLTFESLWSDWYKAQSNPGKYPAYEKPVLSESFNSVTYIANNIDLAKIRTYNQNNPYTSWKNMNTKGTSKFIENEGIITKNSTATTNIYKLGCGPANENEFLLDERGNTILDASKKPIPNLLYIKGCDN